MKRKNASMSGRNKTEGFNPFPSTISSPALPGFVLPPMGNPGSEVHPKEKAEGNNIPDSQTGFPTLKIKVKIIDWEKMEESNVKSTDTEEDRTAL